MKYVEAVDATAERYVHTQDTASSAEVDPVTLEIIHNRLESIANEMGVAVHNTAHTVVFAETKDFSCAVFDHHARMVATGAFLPVHQAGAQASLDGLVSEVGLENLGEGDIFMVNDVLHGAWHAPDLTLFAPVYDQGTFLGVVGVVVHHIDMGGMAPSSYCPDATDIYQEGIRFPPTTRLYEGGRLRRDILNIFLTNVRAPQSQYGDLMAQVAGVNTGVKRVQELAAKYGPDLLRDAYLTIQRHTERLVRRAITDLPDGSYVAEDYIDGDGRSQTVFKIRCKLTIHGDSLTLDFRGSDPEAAGFINSHWGNTSANAYPAVWSHIIPYVPKNYGATVPIELISERGTLVNASPAAPVGACTTETGYAIHTAVFLAMNQANPRGASGVWGGALGIPLIWGSDHRTGRFFVTLLESGVGMGGGARETMDGWPTASLKGSNITLPNIEIEELAYPIVYLYRRLSSQGEPGAGGAGRQRGGSGCNFAVRPLAGPLRFTSIISKCWSPPLGCEGGEPGGKSLVELIDPDTGAVVRELPPKIMDQPLDQGAALHFVVAGGGGYGSPWEREPEAVRNDVLDGLVTIEQAEETYGVVIQVPEHVIDDKATRRLRALRGS